MASMQDKMIWLMNEIQNICKYVDVNREAIGYYNDREDICSDTIVELLSNPKLIDEIYQTKNLARLKKIVLCQIYKLTGNECCPTTKDYNTLQKIRDVCNKEKIEQVPSNAYKIAALMKNSDISILTIKRILTDGYSKTSIYEDDIAVDFFGGIL